MGTGRQKALVGFALIGFAFAGCRQEIALVKEFRDWGYSQNPAAYLAGDPIAPNRPSLKGEHFAVSPALPKGLTLDPLSGEITGTPAVLAREAPYTVTLTTSAGSSSTVLTLSTFDGKAPVITRFEMPAFSSTSTININSLVATDDFGVTGFCVTEIDNPATCAWSALAPGSTSTRIAVVPGTAAGLTFFAFARDAAGNISQSKRAEVAVNAAINGSCGGASLIPTTTKPIESLCTAGTPSLVTGAGPWSWSCIGILGGLTASCTAPLAEPPGCVPSTVTRKARILFMVDHSTSNAILCPKTQVLFDSSSSPGHFTNRCLDLDGNLITPAIPGTDPNGVHRKTAIINFLNQYSSKTNFSYSIGKFGGVIYPDGTYSFGDSLIRDMDSATWVPRAGTPVNPFAAYTSFSSFMNNYDLSSHGVTPYRAAIDLLNKTILADIRGNLDPVTGKPEYVYAVLFLSDGAPTDISGSETLTAVRNLVSQVEAAGAQISMSAVYYGASGSSASELMRNSVAVPGKGKFIDVNANGNSYQVDDVLTIPCN